MRLNRKCAGVVMKPIEEKRVELIVAIPSFMEADTIGFVTHQVDLGIKNYFGNMGAVIVNVDNNRVPRDIVSTNAVPALTVVRLLASLYNCPVEITPEDKLVKDAEGTVRVDK